MIETHSTQPLALLQHGVSGWFFSVGIAPVRDGSSSSAEGCNSGEKLAANVTSV